MSGGCGVDCSGMYVCISLHILYRFQKGHGPLGSAKGRELFMQYQGVLIMP